MAEIYRFDDPSASFAKGYDQVNMLRQNQATMAAGRDLQSGNYQGASGDLYGAGMIADGSRVQAQGEARQADVEAQRTASDQAAAKFTADAAGRLRQLSDSAQGPDKVAKVLAGFDQLVPMFKEHGETDDDLAQLRQHLQTDPDTTLTVLGAAAAKAAGYEVRNAGDEVMVIDKATGKLVDRYRGAKTATLGDGAQLYDVPGTGGAPASPTAAPTGAPAMAPGGAAPASNRGQISPDAVWQSIKTQESGGEASPGTAVGPDTPSGNAYGSTQMLPATAEAMARKIGIAWNPAYMRENTPKALAYQDKLGRAYFDEGLARSGGDPAAAAAYYFAGPDPAQHGPKTRKYVTDVMNRAGGVQPYEVASTGATPPPPTGPRLLAENPKDPKGGSGNGEPGGVVDPTIVKALIEGRIMPPTQKAAASPYWQAQLQAATQQDPSFDGVNFQSRAKTRADFTSGKSAQNITALNTVIGHLDHLDHSITGLNNTDNLGPLNKINNTAAHVLADWSGTDARVKTFENAKVAVANELTRVFRGSGGAEADIQAWQKQLDGASSPQALHAVVRSMAELINSRVEALGEQYNQGMGTTHDAITLLTPDKQKSFARLMSGERPGASATAAPAHGSVIRYDAQGNRIP